MPDKNFSVKHFLLNEHFQQWVKAPDAENRAYWQNFIRLHPEAREDIEEARKIIEQLVFYAEPRSEATKSRIKANIDKAIYEEASQQESTGTALPLYPASSNPQKKVSFHRKWMGIAASLTGLMLLLGIYFVFFNAEHHTVYATDYGETRTIILPDQSVVRLNANSTLKLVEDDWDNTSERKVWLEGEAFFKVEKRKTPEGKPAKFVVHSGKVRVEVLGTSFNVNSRRRETKVVLSSGKVKLNMQQVSEHAIEEILMEPGDMVAVKEGKREIEKKIVDTSYYTAWKENKLIFEHTPIPEIIQLIEDNYGFKVSVKSTSLLEKAFTGAAPADKLDILLDKMSVVYHLNISKHEREITITIQDK